MPPLPAIPVHRLTAGIEDAGLEVRDQLVWLYGTGLPKSGLRNGRGSALKPAYEPIVLARAPLSGTLGGNESALGTGALGIDEARITAPERPIGRWPANVMLSHAARCGRTRCIMDCPVALIDRARPTSRPSRILYCAKPTAAEREGGCEDLAAKVVRLFGEGGRRPRRNIHPTVKPIALMRWLVRLTCPPGGVVLDPFAGSGSTGAAVVGEGCQFVGIERERAYVAVARARLAHWSGRAGDHAHRAASDRPRQRAAA